MYSRFDGSSKLRQSVLTFPSGVKVRSSCLGTLLQQSVVLLLFMLCVWLLTFFISISVLFYNKEFFLSNFTNNNNSL